VPDATGEDEVKICVAFGEDAAVEPGELVAFLAQRMTSFMVPRYVEVFDELPKTTATKRVRKVELREDPLNERTWDRMTGFAR
jgi:crotonobetaine/carnitine-CoA ligase